MYSLGVFRHYFPEKSLQNSRNTIVYYIQIERVVFVIAEKFQQRLNVNLSSFKITGQK